MRGHLASEQRVRGRLAMRPLAIRQLGIGLLAWTLSVAPAWAMTLVREGPDLFATGPTVDADFLAFKQALAQPGIQRLVLVNAPGGDLWTGMQVSRMVQAAGIKTVTSGYCISACSLIFIGGRERGFGSGFPPPSTLVGIHGAHNRLTKQVDTQLMPQMYALYKMQIGERFDAEVINQALYRLDDAGGLLRLRALENNLPADRTAVFCPGGQTPPAGCTRHEGKDALTLGVVTQRETEPVTLPESMRDKPMFFGQPLGAAPEDLAERVGRLIEKHCGGSALCRDQTRPLAGRYLSQPLHRALAIGASSSSYGYVYGASDATTAMLRALSTCNFAGTLGRLCRVVAVNEHTVDELNDAVAAASRTQLQDLPEPQAAALMAEAQEPGGSAPSGLRTGAAPIGMTPARLEGITRLSTADLRKMMLGGAPPVLIDVAAGGPMLPGALNLVNAGLAYDETPRERAFDERFRKILFAAAPDRDRPLVFYCTGVQCWASANAAMRARQAGYTQVHWYRGGQAAWQAAGLPVTPRAPVGFIY